MSRVGLVLIELDQRSNLRPGNESPVFVFGQKDVIVYRL
jgi:hypothetical protein